MKIKFLSFAAAAIALSMVACNKSDLGQQAAKNGKTVTVNASFASVDSKVSVTPNADNAATSWTVEWNKGDIIGGWSEGEYNDFAMNTMTSSKEATFAGTVSNNYDLTNASYIFPYNAAAVSGSTLSVDLSVQNGDSNFESVSNNMVMISDLGTAELKHKTTVLNLRVETQAWIPPTTLLYRMEISGDKIGAKGSYDLEAGGDFTTTAAPITVVPDGIAGFDKDHYVSLAVSAFPFTLAPGESFTVTMWVFGNNNAWDDKAFVGDANNPGRSRKYTITKTNTTGADLPFAAGSVNDIILNINDASCSTYETFSELGMIGEGTKENPYLVSTAGDLKTIAAKVTENLFLATPANTYNEEVMAETNNCLGEYYRLTNDLDLTGYNAPIGKGGINEFRGNFDGDGHTISNYFSLFNGITRDAVVENLNVYAVIDNMYLTNSGGITGMNRGVIKNCTFSGSVKAKGFIGGIAGNGTGSIIDCVNYGDIEVTNQSGSGGADAGGILGYYPGKESYRIVNCANFGDIKGTNNIGGIAGRLVYVTPIVNKLINCYSAGTVTNTGTAVDVGAFAGKLGGGNNLINCYIATESEGDGVTPAAFVTIKDAAEMKNADFVTALSAAYESDDILNDLVYENCAWTNIDGVLPTPVSGTAAGSIAPVGAPTELWSTQKSPNFGGGLGTEATPYLITSAYELAHLADAYNAASYYKLTKNIDLTGYIWTPIAAIDAAHFIQGAYTIKGIYMNGTYDNDSIFE